MQILVLTKIEQLLTSFLGPTKDGFTDEGQAQFNCPKCKEENGGIPDNKFNLEVNVFKGKYRCWKCSSLDSSMQGSIIHLIKKYGGKNALEKYYEIIKSIKDSQLLDINLFKNIEKAMRGEDFISLPLSYKTINLATCRDKKLVEYLNKRKINQDIINFYHIGYTDNSDPKRELRNRIIVPSYDEYGYLSYWVGRDFLGYSKSKYCNIKAEKDAIIWQESTIQFDADIYLCEGVLDSLYAPNCIALMGKTLNKNGKLYKTLQEKANANIIICLDSDTKIEETKKIYKMLNRGRLKGKIYYIRLEDYKDFGEIYERGEKKLMIDTLKKIKQFTEFELAT
jgi:DNA primase